MNKLLMCLLLAVYLPVSSQIPEKERKITWTDTQDQVPIYNELISIPEYYPGHKIELVNLQFEDQGRFLSLSPSELESIGPEIQLTQKWYASRGKPALEISFIPVIKDPLTGTVRKLTSFSYRLVENGTGVKSADSSPKQAYSGNSVLSAGTWIKIKTEVDGIYRLTFEELVNMGIEEPANVRMFGNGNRMLPKMNDLPRPHDLIENKIYINRGNDGVFGPGDYILFYGQGPVSWDYNEETGMFEYQRHLYSDGSYYFITSSSSGKERIDYKDTPENSPDAIIEYFDDYGFHEKELVNLLKSGREWFGEHFKIITSYEFPFEFPNIRQNSEVKVQWRAAARSPVSSSFSLFSNSGLVSRLNFPSVNMGSVVSDYAVMRGGAASFGFAGDNINLIVEYTQNTASAEGWLDYLLLNVKRHLAMEDKQMHFRNAGSVNEGQTSQFIIDNAPANLRVWDITDPLNISEPETVHNGTAVAFSDLTNQLNQYVAFEPDGYLTPEIIGNVPNQNLRGSGPWDMIIVSHPLFLNQAGRLANHRSVNDNLGVKVVTPQQIYNEFSSGKPDISAIRDFMKMLYDRPADESGLPHYLLLFGKGSYDNRPGDPSGGNFIPTYQSLNSLRPTQSFVSDDFFGLLDDNEGEFSGLVDIGIGRLPVTTPEQASAVVNKIINYNTIGNKGDWQNVLSFIGDDGDNNLHMRDADILAETVRQNYPVYNIEKIYLDAWPKTGTSLGQRYPDVNDAIAERIRKGALIINYTGHGNELRLADENILDINDVLSWKNQDRLPVFMTATCEFSRFDNPARVSAGEMLLLNPSGGSIALFSTTRLVYATPNFFLNQNFYRYIFEKEYEGRTMRLGDVMRLTKISTGSGINKRNFTLLGDPAMKLAVPRYNVMITSVNESPVTEIPDTLKALSKVNIGGKISDEYGTIAGDFEGTIYHTVFDKTTTVNTLGNDGGAPFSFTSRNNIIYKGKASVRSGEFEFAFIVPKDIAYHYGHGKVSSWASSENKDAAGYFKNIVIGGTNPEPVTDTEGPEINLYMNDKGFVSGGITNQNPLLIAYLSDSSGINTVGSGIGHDITLVFNNDPSNLTVLNDYYVADTDSYQSGMIEYPFSDLEEGNYTLRLKAWDVFNNSSESSLDFTVTPSTQLEIRNVFNYPNPFTNNTFFHFEHNQPNTAMDLLIQIFTVSGRLVKTIDSTIGGSGFKPEPVFWDGLDDYGDRIGRGVYIYRIRLRSENGQTAEKYEKLVILK